MLYVGIDMGGTFTDGYFASEGKALTRKVPTYRFDLMRSVVLCLQSGAEVFGEELFDFLNRIDVIRLATTVGTNAVIEGTGSRVGLLVQEGQESLIYHDDAPLQLFDSFLDRTLVRGISWTGMRDGVLQRSRELIDLGVRQIVVSAPSADDAVAHEQATRKTIKERYPEHYLRSVPLQLGTEVTACREDDVRTNTAIVNAYLHRDMANLLYRADEELRSEGLRAPLLVVHANSGVARVSKSTAISTYGSGPSAGLSGAESIARRFNDELVLTADMGGTTLDIGLIVDGRCETDQRPLISDVQVSLPMNRTYSFGCGGSSIASVVRDEVVIGPLSAGAIPGPAAFGRGGNRATVTDADIILGFLRPSQEFGGQFILDDRPAREAIERDVGQPLGCSPEGAAALMKRAVARQLADVIRGFLQDRGLDASDIVMYAFGGAGPLHLGAAAERAGISKLRSFEFGSGFSAFGCTIVDIRHRYEATWFEGQASVERLVSSIRPMIMRGTNDIIGEGFGGQDSRARVILLGLQGVELAGIEASGDLREEVDVIDMCGQLLALDVWDDVTSIVVELTVQLPRLDATHSVVRGTHDGPRDRVVSWPTGSKLTPVRSWSDLPIDEWVEGPLLVEDPDCTHAVQPGWRAMFDDSGTSLWEWG